MSNGTQAPSNERGSVGSGQSLGLDPKLAGALAYLAGFITGIIFWVTEKDNRFVRFHAMQSIMFSVGWIILFVVLSVLSMIPFIGLIISLLLLPLTGLAILVVWLLLMYKAYQGEEFELPIIGEMARKQLG